MGSENMFLELPCETKYFEAENSGCMYNEIIIKHYIFKYIYLEM